MNLQELDSYNLADAVKFNKQLNPRLWQKEQMRPEVRDKLLEIAADFKEFLGLSDLEVKDITISGSNAGYTYTPYSDIDLHLVVDIPQADSDDVYRELFDAKKYQYNDLHNIKIGGYDVELYVENANKPPVSQGVFSVLNNDWINIPRYRKSTVDDDAVRSKYEDFKHRIDDAVKSNDMERIDSLAKKIKTYRQAGLDAHGELGPENLAYKMLRTQGYITKLYDARAAARDAELSLAEQNKVKKPFVYGYKSVAEDVTSTPDGVGASTRMFLSEKPTLTQEEIIRDFLTFAVEELGIENVPKLRLKKDPAWSIRNKSFGRYDAATGELIVALGNRHVMDVLRTLAHELTHRKQDETETMPPDAGETGSSYENEANARAGVLMRDYAGMHPEYFEDVAVNEASGYIPTRAQAKDPRFNMALTVDVHPGQTGKEANKMALKTNKQGKPDLLIKSANLLKEYEEFKAGIINEEQDLFEVKMTSKNLSKLAKDIPGVKVGLEFEMIVPNVSSDDDGDQEPDYDQDERVRDIDDAINFFDDGDYNYSGVLRRAREEMESNFFDWQMEQIDNSWDEQGFEFFKEYLDREDPFLPEDYEDRAEDEVKADYPDLDPTSDEFEELKSQKLREIEDNYYQETWESQGRSYDRAREEFDEEQRDNFSEQDWLESEGIRYASDIQNAYTDLTWPYWRRSGGEGETDTKEVALDFMNYMGYNTVAVGDYHGYGGGYEKWNGSEWVNIGSNKPDDCFTIEPDGSLQADESSDTGLEFVSPPIPLDQIGETMKKVQQWAGENGVYTGKSNATSMHTNISIPGYDLDKLDYLKAALLLGDEHVLRQFDRIGNTYAKPAIEKVKQLVSAKPEKAKELLDKMKSQLNAEASKLIHTGQTDKYTSINTKDNRVEFRSPGGDYLSDIADNPQKMIDAINRMVVTLDAAMDPNKYKEEYQKKLYKVLTGQGGGREAKTGAKQEMKKDDKDLLNIFSRYAAGELPKAALKSFVRQAQLERKVARQKDEGVKMWWNVARDGQRIEVVATNEMDAKLTAAKEWGIVASDANLSSMAVKPLRPYDDTASGPQVVAQQPTTPQWGVWDIQQGGFVNSFGGIGPGQGRLIGGDTYDAARNSARNNGLLDRLEGGEFEIRQVPQEQPAQQQDNRTYRITSTGGTLIAGDEYGSDQEALQRAQYWAQRRGVDVIVRNPQGEEVGRVSASGEITPAAQSDSTGNWGIWLTSSNRFVRAPGQLDNSVLRRFPSREAAEQFLAQTRGERPDMRTDIEVREIEPAAPVPGSTLDLQRQRAAQQGVDTNRDYELYNRTTGEVIQTYQFSNDEIAMNALNGYQEGPGSSNPENFGIRRGPGVTNTAQQSSVNNLTPRGPGPWEVASTSNNQVYYNTGHTNRNAAETEARTWIQQMGLDPAEFEVRTRESVSRRAPNWEIRDSSTNRLVHQFYAPDRQEAAIIAGDFYDDNDFVGDNYTVQSIGSGADAAQSGIITTANEPATGSQVGQTYNPSGTGSFTGQWLVLNPNNQVIYRFGGIGNAQSDANRIAMDWLTQNPQQMVDGVTVVPEMG